MKKNFIKGTAVALVAASCMAVGAIGASSLQSISAYLNYGITVKYDGQEQQMYDANGQRVYPISYNGTTYVPIRAVGNMMGIDVAWDGANNAVLLGKTGMALDFIESFTPYSTEGFAFRSDYAHSKINDGEFLKFGNYSYSHFIKMRTYYDTVFSMYYDIGGKYDTFTIDVYSETDSFIRIYGDNDELLDTIHITGNNLPKTHTISVSGVQQLRIASLSDNNSGFLYIVDATIE